MVSFGGETGIGAYFVQEFFDLEGHGFEGVLSGEERHGVGARVGRGRFDAGPQFAESHQFQIYLVLQVARVFPQICNRGGGW
jgi:hypothetical protein